MKTAVLRFSVIVLLILPLAFPAATRADTVALKDGSIIRGRVTAIAKGVITVSTPFAGDLSIKQDHVLRLSTNDPMYVRTAGQETVLGRIEAKGPELVVHSRHGTYATTLAEVKASWRPGAIPPGAIEPPRRHWKVEVTTDLAGKSGNASGFSGALGAKATLKGPEDTLTFHASTRRATANGQTAENSYAGGVGYNAFFSKVWSWYASTELLQDNVRDIALRADALAGLGWNAIRSPHQSLQFRAGLSYRYETYNTVPPTPNFASAGLNLGLVHQLDIHRWMVMHNKLSIVPSFKDVNNLLIIQDSNVTLPLGGAQGWSLRVGLSDEYTSRPVGGARKLDTTYYLRFVYDLKRP